MKYNVSKSIILFQKANVQLTLYLHCSIGKYRSLIKVEIRPTTTKNEQPSLTVSLSLTIQYLCGYLCQNYLLLELEL